MSRWGKVAAFRFGGCVYAVTPVLYDAPPTPKDEECIDTLVFTGVEPARGFSKAKMDKLLVVLRRQWAGKEYRDWLNSVATDGQVTEMKLEQVIHDARGYWVVDPEAPAHVGPMGPYESKELARNMAWIRSLASEIGCSMPRATCRYRHYNGIEYTVLGISNLHSNRSDYEVRVFYQGDNGRVWDKPIEEFMRKLKLVVSNEPVHSITDAGPAQVMFADLQGQVCVAREVGIENKLSFGPETLFADLTTGGKVRSEMIVDKAMALRLAAYLRHFATHGRLPDNSLSSDVA